MSPKVIWFLIICWFAVGVILYATGCNYKSNGPRMIQLESGRVIECNYQEQKPCGTTFAACKDGIVYQCQNNYGELN